MWHNMHAAKVERGLADRGEGAAPNFELVNNASSGDWSGATAIVSVRAGLKRLELDITVWRILSLPLCSTVLGWLSWMPSRLQGWDALATEAAAWAMRYNNVFKTFKAGAKVSSAAVLLCPILEYNSVLLKFQMVMRTPKVC